MKEIERKYVALFDGSVFDRQACDKILQVRQGYVISRPSVEWRIRSTRYEKHRKYAAGSTHYFTALKFGNGFVRREYEVKIPKWMFSILAPMAGTLLRKDRYQSNGWEIDIFWERWIGLALAECEIPSEDTPLPLVPRGVTLLADVTEAADFANKRLARMSIDDARQKIADAYPRTIGFGHQYD